MRPGLAAIGLRLIPRAHLPRVRAGPQKRHEKKHAFTYTTTTNSRVCRFYVVRWSKASEFDPVRCTAQNFRHGCDQGHNRSNPRRHGTIVEGSLDIVWKVQRQDSWIKRYSLASFRHMIRRPSDHDNDLHECGPMR